MTRKDQKGWHSRGYLPHLDAVGEIQMVTFRLGDALPAKVIEGWKQELGDAGKGNELQERITRYEDAGHGSCVLMDPDCARMVEGALLSFDGERYRLLEWCVMPNHVHALVVMLDGFRLGDAVNSWKSFTARRINERLGRKGALWGADYFDRYVRNEEHLANARAYIRSNPVKAGLCADPEDWEWGSAWGARVVD